MKGTLVIGLLAALSASACMSNSANTAEPADQAANKAMTANVKGEKVYQSACMSCHAAKGKAVIAPPIFAVKNHVMDQYPERDAFIERVKSWVKAPNADDALMRGAIKKFGLMPAMPSLSDEDLQAVSEYLYDTDMDLPDWYRQHYKEEHGEEPKQH